MNDKPQIILFGVYTICDNIVYSDISYYVAFSAVHSSK